MSAGRSVRNETSVEPGLPKIVVIPKRRITSKVASRTVQAAPDRPSPGSPPAVAVTVASVSVIGTFDHIADPMCGICSEVGIVFASRT